MFEESKYIRVEISAGAVAHNFKLFHELVGPSVKVFTLIKANCYGHGSELLLPILSQHADGCVAATPTEALHARQFGYEGDLLVLFASGCERFTPVQRDVVTELIFSQVALTITSQAEAEFIADIAEKISLRAPVHIMVDSGMTRSGILPDGAVTLVEKVRNCGWLKLAGIYTHLATADEADKSFANKQLDTFDKVLAKCDIRPGDDIMRHAANSPGIIELRRSHYDMVRLGLSCYGYHSSFEMHNRINLRPALKMVSIVMQKKLVPMGSKVGYGCTYTCEKDTVVGLVPVGYGDGYLREYSNRAKMIVRGCAVPVIGRVSMDQAIVDLTDVPESRIGDEIIVISNNPTDPNSVENLAALVNTVPQVITTQLTESRINRVLVE